MQMPPRVDTLRLGMSPAADIHMKATLVGGNTFTKLLVALPW
jgi:hypothetical protein